MQPIDCLGLVLHFLCGAMAERTLCQLFGIVPASLSRYLNVSLVALHLTLRRDVPEAKVAWPSAEEMKQLAALTNDRHPLVYNVWGVVDGTNIDVENPGAALVQNAYYNKWKGSTKVANLFVFALDGTIRYAYVNAPGITLFPVVHCLSRINFGHVLIVA
jgi:hypothetical protein